MRCVSLQNCLNSLNSCPRQQELNSPLTEVPSDGCTLLTHTLLQRREAAAGCFRCYCSFALIASHLQCQTQHLISNLCFEHLQAAHPEISESCKFLECASSQGQILSKPSLQLPNTLTCSPGNRGSLRED